MTAKDIDVCYLHFLLIHSKLRLYNCTVYEKKYFARSSP